MQKCITEQWRIHHMGTLLLHSTLPKLAARQVGLLSYALGEQSQSTPCTNKAFTEQNTASFKADTQNQQQHTVIVSKARMHRAHPRCWHPRQRAAAQRPWAHHSRWPPSSAAGPLVLGPLLASMRSFITSIDGWSTVLAQVVHDQV